MLLDALKLQADLLGARTDLAANLLGGPLLQHLAPRARKPRPVITIPGFLASDASLLRLNRFLEQQGFRCRSWGMGRNLGPRGAAWEPHLERLAGQLGKLTRAMSDEASAPVALIGQSLGGVYARELALRMDGEVDRIIMLGSPTFHPYRADRHNRVIGSIGYWFNRLSAAEFAGRDGLLHWEPDRPAVPCIAIHSPIDGIVDEQACHIPGYIVKQSTRRAPRENIRVLSSHIGMSVNPWVLLAVADRLLADRRRWQAFDPFDYLPGYLAPFVRLVYPSAERIWADRGAGAFVNSHQ